MNETFALKGLFIDTPEIGAVRNRQGFLVCEDGKVAGCLSLIHI